jgi:hypothetical protein
MNLPFDTFAFTTRKLEGRIARVGYRLVGSAQDLPCEETFELPFDVERSAADPADVAAALAGLHLIAGISYWKTCCPARIEIEQDGLDAADTAFWTETYNAGLGEFYYRNGLDPTGSARFPAGSEAAATAGQVVAGPAIVLAGGGKDSVVAYEIARASAATANGGPIPLSVVPAGSDWQLAPNRDGGLRVERRLDPRLFELNAAGAYNGHVPFSAILAFTSQLVAVIGGFGEVIAANERSASAGNLEVDGIEVNHQWSKGLRFERLFQDWQLRHLRRVPVYFSLLRPLSELRIARIFAAYPEWFPAVTSCNANFLISGGATGRWCGRCAKCVFAAIMLAPWLDEDGATTVFGANPLADPQNLPVVRQLLGIDDHKPWECVGTPGEVAAALWLASQRAPLSGLAVIRWFSDTVGPSLELPDQLVGRELAPGPSHLLPERWRDALADYLATR